MGCGCTYKHNTASRSKAQYLGNKSFVQRLPSFIPKIRKESEQVGRPRERSDQIV